MLKRSSTINFAASKRRKNGKWYQVPGYVRHLPGARPESRPYRIPLTSLVRLTRWSAINGTVRAREVSMLPLLILGVHLEVTQPKVVVTYRPEPIVAELTEHTESTASSMSEVFDLE